MLEIGVTYSQSIYSEFQKNGDKNLFEVIIDNLMIEKYSSPEVAEYINSLKKEDKRTAILSLLDGDNNMWKKLKSFIKGNDIPKIDHLKDVVLMLREYVKVGEVEKKKYGEVMTSLDLVKEMISTLPCDVWSNPNLKWLDPANGTGPFPLMVIYKLMCGLEKFEPDPEKRYRHIVEKMIYTCELQSRNVFLWLCAIDPKDEYSTNTYWGSFLDSKFESHKKDVWGVEKFDIIIGNPPYQSSDATGDNKLYLDFSKKSMFLLKENGFLLFITPKNIIDYILICDKNRSYFDRFYKVHYIAIDTPQIYFKGVGSTFAYFLISKVEYYGDTSLKYLNSDKEVCESTIVLKKGESIPNFLSKLDISIVNKIRSKNSEKFDFRVMNYIKNGYRKNLRIRKKQIQDRIVTTEMIDDFIYPVIDGINKSNPFPGKLYFINNDISDKKKKIILNQSGYLCPSYDDSGEFFLSDNLIYIEVKSEENYNNFISLFNSKIMKYWLKQFRLNGFSDSKNIQNFPYLSIDRKWNDIDIFKYFNLDDNEIKFIENIKW
jgi:hypothetical protein